MMRATAWRTWVVAAAALVIALTGAGGLGGCERDPGYSQETPDAVIQTARMMVERGDVRRLPDLVYAEDENMRRVLTRLGLFFDSVKQLGVEVNAAFPDEIAAMRAEAEKAAAEGRATSVFSTLLGASGGQQRGGPAALFRRPSRPAAGQPAQPQPNPQEAFNLLAKQFFANPFGFLAEESGKLSTVFVSDDTVALLYDEQPILPPVGLVLRQNRGKWYLTLPLNLPGVSNFTPKNEKEWAIWGSLIQTFDNAVKDLTVDVRERRVSSLDEVGRKAGEKAFIPAAMVFFAYSRAIESRREGGGGGGAAPGAR